MVVTPALTHGACSGRHDLLGGVGVEIANRSVGKDDARIVCKPPSDRDALLLSAREQRLVAQPWPSPT